MITIKASRPFLDEAGHIYLPLAGPDRSCIRLNRVASDLFRRWIEAPFDPERLSDVERAFLNRLVDRGAIAMGDLPS